MNHEAKNHSLAVRKFWLIKIPQLSSNGGFPLLSGRCRKLRFVRAAVQQNRQLLSGRTNCDFFGGEELAPGTHRLCIAASSTCHIHLG